MDETKARRFLLGSTVGLTPVQVEAAVSLMVEQGESAWHAAATVAERDCFCAKCRPDIRRFC